MNRCNNSVNTVWIVTTHTCRNSVSTTEHNVVVARILSLRLRLFTMHPCRNSVATRQNASLQELQHYYVKLQCIYGLCTVVQTVTMHPCYNSDTTAQIIQMDSSKISVQYCFNSWHSICHSCLDGYHAALQELC